MKARNFCALPPVASASSAAEANGVWTEGNVSANTRLTSRTRRFRSLRSLRSYTSKDVSTNAAVTTNPMTSTTPAAREGRHGHTEPSDRRAANSRAASRTEAESWRSEFIPSSAPARSRACREYRSARRARQRHAHRLQAGPTSPCRTPVTPPFGLGTSSPLGTGRGAR